MASIVCALVPLAFLAVPFVLGGMILVGAPLAMGFGALGLNQTLGQTPLRRGHEMAIAGLMVGLLEFVIFVSRLLSSAQGNA